MTPNFAPTAGNQLAANHHTIEETKMGSVTRELARRRIDKFLNETRSEIDIDATATFGPLEKYVADNDNVPPRAGDFMQTFTGRKYWPMSPRPHEVYIEDIAHSLGLQCRYAGHCIKFYSVAEHSVLIARHLAAKHAPEVALAGLLHDAPEAYCVDIPRPLKPYLTNYRAIEQDNWLAIAARFVLPKELPREVHDADNSIIGDELVNLREMPWHAKHDRPLGVKLRYWSPEEAELEFLATFDALMAGRVAR